MTNSVEIRKQLRSLNFINVKLKSKQIVKWKLLKGEITENECKLHVKCSVAIYSDFECQIKTANYKSFLNFFNLGNVVS